MILKAGFAYWMAPPGSVMKIARHWWSAHTGATMVDSALSDSTVASW